MNVKTRPTKLLSALLSLLLIVTLSPIAAAPAWGDGADTPTISVNDDSLCTYNVYQIFTADVTDGSLSNIKWGTNGTGYSADQDNAVSDKVTTALQSICNDSEGTSSTTDPDQVEVILNYANLNRNPAYTNLNASNPYTNALPGYYLIKETCASDDEAVTQFIVKLVDKGVTISSKDSGSAIVTSELNVASDYSNGTWGVVADYAADSTIKYLAMATIDSAAAYSNFSNFKMKFNITKPKGFSFIDSGADSSTVSPSVVVKADDEEIDSEYYSAQYSNDGIVVTLSDLTQIKSVRAGSKITVEFYEKFSRDSDVVFGGSGNANSLSVTYSNNATHLGSYGETTKSTATVYTYMLRVTSLKGSSSNSSDSSAGGSLGGNTTGGATLGGDLVGGGTVGGGTTGGATLGGDATGSGTLDGSNTIGGDSDTTGGATLGGGTIGGGTLGGSDTIGSGTLDGGTTGGTIGGGVNTSSLSDSGVTALSTTSSSTNALSGAEFTLYFKDGSNTEVGKLTETEDPGVYEIKGIDCAAYLLKETKAPDGYAAESDVAFRIISAFSGQSLTNITTFSPTVTASVDTGILAVEITHGTASEIPISGGMGTTLFYLIGGGLIVAGCLAFGVYRRKRVA